MGSRRHRTSSIVVPASSPQKLLHLFVSMVHAYVVICEKCLLHNDPVVDVDFIELFQLYINFISYSKSSYNFKWPPIGLIH